jgi:hypothetical protein
MAARVRPDGTILKDSVEFVGALLAKTPTTPPPSYLPDLNSFRCLRQAEPRYRDRFNHLTVLPRLILKVVPFRASRTAVPRKVEAALLPLYRRTKAASVSLPRCSKRSDTKKPPACAKGLFFSNGAKGQI